VDEKVCRRTKGIRRIIEEENKDEENCQGQNTVAANKI
jgi:hypothetical protein